MHKALVTAIAFLLIAVSASASYGYYYGGSYGALEYPNSYYNLRFSYWNQSGPYVNVSYSSYSPYHNYSYNYNSGCSNYWCYYPSPNYYAPYYNTYNYGHYSYSPGYRFGFNW